VNHKGDYYSRTETESEADDDNSEDLKFEKKLKKSLTKNDIPNGKREAPEHVTTLHHSQRPKRANAS
jgi:hypothetical protein